MKKIALLFLLPLLIPVEAKPADVTHLGQKIGNHVVLADSFGEERGPCPGSSFGGKDFFRVFPDGTVSVDPFRVPLGFNLVITDVDWRVSNHNLQFATGDNVQLLIRIGNDPFAPVVFHSSTPVDQLDGIAAQNEYLTTGFVVGQGAIICPDTHRVEQGGNIPDQPPIVGIILRGYLFKFPLLVVPLSE